MTEPRYARRPEDFPALADLRQLTGLEYLKKLIAGEFPTMTIAGPLGFRVTHAEEGLVEMAGRPEAICANGFGQVHGGWYGTVLDSCMTCAVISALPRGRVQTTLEFKVNMLRALPIGTDITATGQIEHVGRSTGVARGEIRGSKDGRLYATGTATCFILGTAE
ncbi:MAG: PaaI family thioesterase [Rhodobacteraceae bacterium]|jgi:uncharacterized protein (TIGR00369 family)|nr:PaaI family thioesterase [Paracoccaceae bacterium]